MKKLTIVVALACVLSGCRAAEVRSARDSGVSMPRFGDGSLTDRITDKLLDK
jgi:hypothetical protein